MKTAAAHIVKIPERTARHTLKEGIRIAVSLNHETAVGLKSPNRRRLSEGVHSVSVAATRHRHPAPSGPQSPASSLSHRAERMQQKVRLARGFFVGIASKPLVLRNSRAGGVLARNRQDRKGQPARHFLPDFLD